MTGCLPMLLLQNIIVCLLQLRRQRWQAATIQGNALVQQTLVPFKGCQAQEKLLVALLRLLLLLHRPSICAVLSALHVDWPRSHLLFDLSESLDDVNKSHR